MSTISVNDIQSDPLDFVRRVEAGEALLVVNAERALAQVTPVPAGSARKRPHGLAAGDFTLPADFDDGLPAQLIESFERT